MNPTPNQEETAVRIIVKELRENGGHMAQVGKAAFRFARRLLRLNCKFGWNAEKDLEPFLVAAGFDPVRLRVVDYDKFDAMRAALREEAAHTINKEEPDNPKYDPDGWSDGWIDLKKPGPIKGLAADTQGHSLERSLRIEPDE